MTTRTWFPPLIAAVMALGLYVTTLAPGLVGGDSPEMITASHVVGIPHQPGYPLYVLVGRVVSNLPLGDVARSINGLSALAGAAAVAALVALLMCWDVPPWGAVFLALAPAVSRHTWSQAIVAEVYTIGLALGLVALWLFDRWRRNDRARELVLSAYVGGLAVGHQPLTVMLLAAVALVLLGRLVSRRLALRHIGLAVLAFVFPFTLFALLPIRSAAHVVLDYARIETAGDFFYHAFGVASRSKLLNDGASGVVNTLSLAGSIATHALGPFTIALVVLAIAGAVRLLLVDRERFLLVWLPILLILGFSLLYAIHDIENYLIIPFWLLTLSAGAAAGWIHSVRARGIATMAVGGVLVVSGLITNWRATDRSDFHVVDDFVANTMLCVPEHAALFLYMETLVGPFLYHQAVGDVRPDVELVDMSGKVIPQDYGFRGLTGDWREKRWRRMESLYETPLPALRGRPMATVTTEVRPAAGEPFTYRRRGVVVELVPNGSPGIESHGYWERFRIRLAKPELMATEVNTFMLTPLILDMYTDTAMECAAEYVGRGDTDSAIATYRAVLDFSPKSSLPRLALADLYRRQGRLEDAAEELEVVLSRVPEDVGVLNALGVIRLSLGDRAEAETLFHQSIAIDPGFALARLNLGDLLLSDPSRRVEALDSYRVFLKLAPNDPSVPRVRAIVAESTSPNH